MGSFNKHETTEGSRKIASFFDEGTFVEIGAYIKRGEDGKEYEGVVCGYGSVDGKLAFVFAQDSDRMKGAFDALHAKKIKMLYDMAVKNGAPVIGIFDSVGALVNEGVSSLAAYGTFMECVSKASGVVPQIAVISGVCSGMSAVVAAMFDMAITVKGSSQIYMSTADKAEGFCAAVEADDEQQAFANARKLISILPANNRDSSEKATSDDCNRTVDFDCNNVIESIVDDADFVEVFANCGGESMKTGFAFVGGLLCGIVYANGDMTGKGAKKAAKFIGFCDSFGISVVTLVNTRGFASDMCACASAGFARLAYAYTTATTPKITAVIGEAIGAGYTLMGSKSVGADMEFAVVDSQISALTAEKAVAFLMNDKITADKSRESLEAEWKEEKANPVEAAERGAIDDVIESSELRQRLCAALYMLSDKAESKPSRKHANLPV